MEKRKEEYKKALSLDLFGRHHSTECCKTEEQVDNIGFVVIFSFAVWFCALALSSIAAQHQRVFVTAMYGLFEVYWEWF